MAADDSLFKALDAFAEGVNALQMNRSLSQANDHVREIKQSELNEQEQMKAIRGVADDLTMRLVGGGMDTAKIEQVRSAFGAGQHQADQQNALMMKMFDADQANKRQEDQQAFTAGENAKKALADKNKPSTKKPTLLSDKTTNSISDLDTNTALINSVLSFVKTNKGKVKPGAGNVGLLGKAYSRYDKDYAFLEQKLVDLFNEHRRITTGAAASDTEIERLRADFPNLVNSPEQFEARFKAMLDKNKIKRKVILNTHKQSGRDVSGFAAEGSGALGFDADFHNNFLPEDSDLRSTPREQQDSTGAPAPKANKYF